MARTVNTKQHAEYVGGSATKGWYEYSIQGTDRQGPRLSYFSFYGRAATRQDAIKAAWAAARAWETEVELA